MQPRLIEPIPRERCIPAMEHGQHQAWVESSRAAAAARAAVQQPGTGRGRHVPQKQSPESDYEEIGPPPAPPAPPPVIRPKTVASGRPVNSLPASAAEPASMCDLCGISEAMVRCLLCANQTFCLACDDMYHRHPKRCKHARKAIGSAAAATPAANSAHSAVHRPPLPPKGDVFGAPVGPVAPPRRNAAGSTMNLANGHGNAVGQSATLPRKPSATMSQQNPASGRPLPPTPVENHPQKPTLGRSVSLAYPSPNGVSCPDRKMSTTSQPPMHVNYTNSFESGGGRTHFAPPHSNSPQLPPSQTPPSYPPKPAHLSFNEPNEAGRWNSQPYHEEVHFPTHPMNGGGGRGGTLNRNAGRFSAGKLNKSSSMHDIAHGLAPTSASDVAAAPHAAAEFNPMQNVLVSNDGVSWEDQQLPGVPHWQTTQSAINHPAMSGLLHRPSVNSAQFKKANMAAPPPPKGTHRQPQQPPEFWNPMWSAVAGPTAHGGHAAFDPMMSPFHNPMLTPMHRSMHDLHSAAVSGGFVMGPPQPYHHHHGAAQFMAQQQQRGSSPSNGSQKSRRSGGGAGKLERKRTRRRSGGNSRPHSRNVSSRNSRVRPGSSVASTDDEDEEEDGTEEDEDDSDEDFFTGESDAGAGTASDYVEPTPPPPQAASKSKSASSAPRKAWMCEHCTFVNGAGTSVCTVCCRTSKHSRSGAAASDLATHQPQSSRGASSKAKSKSAARSASTTRRPRSNSSDEEDFEEEFSDLERQRSSKGVGRSSGRQHKQQQQQQQQPRGRFQKLGRGRAGMAKSMTDLDSLGPRGRGAGGGEDDEFDLEQDALNAYYAVRMGERRRSTALLRREDDEGRYDSSSESSFQPMKSNKSLLSSATPAKGILKKATSNPQLAIPNFTPNVVDINKYLKQQQHHHQDNDADEELWAGRASHEATSAVDAWSTAGTVRTHNSLRDPHSPAKSLTTATPENDYMSDVASNGGDYRTSRRNDEESEQRQQYANRRSSETGRKNFRSKRFSRHMERNGGGDTQKQRAHSAHSRIEEDPDGEWRSRSASGEGRGARSKTRLLHSESSTSEDAAHPFDNDGAKGPGGIGSYLSRREFGSNEDQKNNTGDSGYISHGSGFGAYPKMKLPSQAPIDSFTMSVDRGYLGGGGGDEGPRSQYRSMEDLTAQKNKGMELVRLLRDAEKGGFTPEDLQVALNHCGESNPVLWLAENMDKMIATVTTLSNNVGNEAEKNTTGNLTSAEAREALRKHKGNVWAAVTECVEGRQAKFDELSAKGNFEREDIINALTSHEGNFDAAFQELNKLQLKPFLMKVWGQPEAGEVTSGAAKEPTVSAAAEVASASTSSGLPADLKVPASEEDPVKFEQERQARRHFAKGLVPTFEKAELVVQLTTLYYEEEEAVKAALACDSLEKAEAFLTPECELCTNTVRLRDVVEMPSCEHRCCQQCAGNYFTIAIKDKSINEAFCPFCQAPKDVLADDTKDDEASEYFAKLDAILRKAVAEDVYDLFQRKLRDRALMRDPNFKWCYKCSSGFIADMRYKRLVCPECRAISCAKCFEPWLEAHEGISCEEFAKWKADNDPDNQAAGLERQLAEHGVTCPSCKHRFLLSLGGCMHFTCTQCKFEFCIGCERPFKMGVRCGKEAACAKLGLHAHHPRNCLFYLRDKEPADLQKLLKNNKVEYKTEAEDSEKGKACTVQVQKETKDGMVDAACGETTIKGHAGFCKIHYVEYLCALVFRNNVDPVSVLDIGELKQVFTRANHFMPKQRPGEYEFRYKRRLAETIQQEIPLDKI